MLFMLMTPNVDRRVIVLTEKDMFERCRAEKDAGRAPREVEFMLAEIPEVLRTRLVESRQRAAKEVKPE
jgi:hypothetical protein